MRSAVAAIVLLALSAYTPRANTRREIKKYVNAAARHIAQHGPSCSEFAEREWRSGDYYIFVIGPDKRTLCHPDATLIGKPSGENDRIVAAAMKMRGGWVDYPWPRISSGKMAPKSTYAERVKSPDGDVYIVASGGYGLR